MSSTDVMNLEVRKQLKKIIDIERNLDKVALELKCNFDDEKEEIEKHKEFIKNPDFQIAIVGAVKAGKSTFINAFLGEEIASAEVTPETAALTKFRYSENNHLEISFYNEKEWKKLWDTINKSKEDGRENIFFDEYNNLKAGTIEKKFIGKETIITDTLSMDELIDTVKQYTSKRSREHYFVKELVVCIDNKNIPDGITVVDTPGLNDVVAYRSDITRSYIRRANVVIICVKAESIQNEEYLTVAKCFENVGDDKSKVIILGTQLDRANNPKEDWAKQNVEWKKYFKRFYYDDKLMNKNMLAVSSYVFNCLNKIDKDLDCKEEEVNASVKFSKYFGIEKKKGFIEIGNEFNNNIKFLSKNIEDIKKITNISSVSNIIKNIAGNASDILAEDIKIRYKNITKSIKVKVTSLKKENDEKAKIINKSEEEKVKFIKEKQKNKAKLKKNKEKLNSFFSKIEKDWSDANKKIKEQLSFKK